jgi:hypothetical protein
MIEANGSHRMKKTLLPVITSGLGFVLRVAAGESDFLTAIVDRSHLSPTFINQ